MPRHPRIISITAYSNKTGKNVRNLAVKVIQHKVEIYIGILATGGAASCIFHPSILGN